MISPLSSTIPRIAFSLRIYSIRFVHSLIEFLASLTLVPKCLPRAYFSFKRERLSSIASFLRYDFLKCSNAFARSAKSSSE